MKLYNLLRNISFELLNGDLSVDIVGIEDNSKNVKNGNLFFAIKGTRVNGEEYISEAINNGAIAIVVENKIELTDKFQNVVVIKVDCVRSVVGEIAKNYYCLKFCKKQTRDGNSSGWFQ